MQVFPNISRCKGNQEMKFGQLIECAMKFGQLIECNARNIFPEKSYTKWGGETSPCKLSISLDQQSRALNSLFLLYDKLKAIEIY